MSFRRGISTLWVPVPIAGGAVPLHAQFVAAGCPQGPSGVPVNGFTAGTPAPSELCLTGSFQAREQYNVALSSPPRTVTAGGTASTTLLAGGAGELAIVPTGSGVGGKRLARNAATAQILQREDHFMFQVGGAAREATGGRLLVGRNPFGPLCPRSARLGG